MSDVKNRMVLSVKSFHDIRVLVFCGFMGALSVVLGQFSWEATQYLTITCAWIPNRIVDALFGPFTGMIYGGVMDVVKYLVKPSGGYQFFFTLVPMVAGLLTGLILYRRRWTIPRVILAQFLLKLICNVLMTTWGLSFFYGRSLIAILPLRAAKNAVSLAVDAVILYLILRAFEKTILPQMKNAGWPVFMPDDTPKEESAK